MSDPKERLIRIMGTFDLATGHADTWDELLDSLESEELPEQKEKGE